jgi:hypothetical protein
MFKARQSEYRRSIKFIKHELHIAESEIFQNPEEDVPVPVPLVYPTQTGLQTLMDTPLMKTSERVFPLTRLMCPFAKNNWHGDCTVQNCIYSRIGSHGKGTTCYLAGGKKRTWKKKDYTMKLYDDGDFQMTCNKFGDLIITSVSTGNKLYHGNNNLPVAIRKLEDLTGKKFQPVLLEQTGTWECDIG